VKGFYSPIDKLAAELPRTKGTGAEFMTELSKRPGYKPQEAQDRDLQTLMALPKMAREEFLAKLKSKPAPKLEETTLDDSDDDYPKDNPVKYEQYTLPGGTNYREILMRMPHDEQRAKEFSDPASGHWDTPNVLAHVRAKDRTGPNGEKLLHIEEIQSDWHQKGREHGYATPESLKEFRAVELRHKLLKQKLDEAKAQSESAENSLKRKEPLFQQPDVRERYEAARVKANNDLMDLMPQVMKAQAEVQDFGHKMNSMVPNAPFKKNWHEMALKKMIHHAAENGYHGIVITPGAEQADRYNLAKYVNAVSVSPTGNGTYMLDATLKGGGKQTKTNLSPSDVENMVGKELAAKLLTASDERSKITQSMREALKNDNDDEYDRLREVRKSLPPAELAGLDLQVGGEGMKGFYDKMVPSFLNQFGKKYGAQVSQMQVPVKHQLQGLRTMGGYPDDPPMNLHHFPITPEMREDVTKNGVPLYADGGSVEGKEPEKTVKAYKMFRVDKKQPGKLFPLFVDSQTPVEMDKWITAKEGEKSTTNAKKVKSKIGDLAYRPGWHAGDLPIATHIGDKDEEQKAEARRIRELRDAHAAVLGNTKAAKAMARKEHPYPSWVNAPRLRNPNHIWAEVEMPNDVNWQSEATKRGTNDQGKLIASQAHITDQLPLGGHYRYKTNSNMLGNWLIGGSMKVNRILHDKEVEAINKAAGAADLPRAKAMNQKAFGFAEGGTVGPEEWMAEEHVNHKAKSSALPRHERDANLAQFLKDSAVKNRMYHGTNKDIKSFKAPKNAVGIWATKNPDVANEYATISARGVGEPPSVYPVHVRLKNPANKDQFGDAWDLAAKDSSRLGWNTHDERHKKILQDQGFDGAILDDSVVVFDPKHIKSAIGNRGTYDVNEPDITKAKGGSIKPVGYTKEKVTVSPSLDQMRYELISVKHSKKVK